MLRALWMVDFCGNDPRDIPLVLAQPSDPHPSFDAVECLPAAMALKLFEP